ncbi:hypothetical protein [Rhizobium leguminosarum]|uniref:hypothetical protein n=1 Tax=Rhizobium leguminosarum TaxID=384 RepID=UPI0013EE6BF6|nr:hypothetical protein [Rhizobium leguminosarum]MBP2487655.1 ABC-type nickel/cobalt efflux system permease component RcnA [Rhizobium leguminosarum]QIO71235.1 hypothetical protein HA459_03980 [Rhizobium leguminosarum bv. trifolii]QIO78251.1 hypothetical protein HA460_04005 [Rhizobium leguminosarum bv. trifolii]WHO80183.1 hypothetical protein QMO81_002893 [Rhizobium leguminosarum]WSH70015.1 hypothetical protein U8Q02_12770 [Rhizobium leguminosarum]
METAQFIDQVATPIGVAIASLFVFRRKRPNAERMSWIMSIAGAAMVLIAFVALKRFL